MSITQVCEVFSSPKFKEIFYTRCPYIFLQDEIGACFHHGENKLYRKSGLQCTRKKKCRMYHYKQSADFCPYIWQLWRYFRCDINRLTLNDIIWGSKIESGLSFGQYIKSPYVMLFALKLWSFKLTVVWTLMTDIFNILRICHHIYNDLRNLVVNIVKISSLPIEHRMEVRFQLKVR